ncbi:MAG: hypothetical protein ACOC8B_08175 [Gemmatimonadota bacterium]
MMSKRTILVLLGAAVVGACETSERASSPVEGDAPPADSIGPATYTERLLFVPLPNTDSPTALFDFGARVDSAGVERSMRVWLARAGAWTPLDSAAWTMDPMREPWRLVPYGPLGLVVDDAGELETLIYRGDDAPLRLVAGETIGEWSPARSARLRIRRAELVTGDGPRSGMLLDAHVRLPPDAGSRDPIRTVYLTDGRGAHVVVLDGVLDDGVAWLRDGARDRSWRGVRIEPTAFRSAPTTPANDDGATAMNAADTADAGQDADGPPAAPRLPTAWRVVSDDGRVGGRLELIGGSDTGGVYTVRGTIEVEGRDLAVEGVVRYGAA